MKFSSVSIVLGLLLVSIGGLNASADNALKRPTLVSHPAIHPSPTVLREFAVTALRHLNGPAQRPFLQLLKSLPPAKQAGVTISTKATKNMQCSGGVCTPTSAVAVLNGAQLAGMLADGSVTIGTSAQAPDIFVNAPFSWTSANGLTLQAIGNIVVNKAVSDSGPAPLTLSYNVNGSGGALSFGPKGHVSFMSTGNAVTINGQGYILANNISLLAQLIARNPSGSFALSANYNAKHDGKYTHSPIPTTFGGRFEGLGNRIMHLSVESEGQQPTGFFQQTVATARIENFTIVGKFEVAGPNVGGLVAQNGGTLFQTVFDGSITVPGDCFSNAMDVGGLVGFNSGTISFSHATGSITGTLPCSDNDAGGLVGETAGNIDHSWAGVTLSLSSVNNTNELGGLAGAVFPTGTTVDETFATGSIALVDGSGGRLGGLIGDLEYSRLSRSSASGAVNASGSSSIGGLVADDFGGTIDASVATGAVSGGSSCNCGGGLGNAIVDSGLGATSNTTSFGMVTAGLASSVGGFLGLEESEGDMSNDGWCTTSSGITDPSQGAGNIPNDPGIAPFTC